MDGGVSAKLRNLGQQYCDPECSTTTMSLSVPQFTEEFTEEFTEGFTEESTEEFTGEFTEARLAN